MECGIAPVSDAGGIDISIPKIPMNSYKIFIYRYGELLFRTQYFVHNIRSKKMVAEYRIGRFRLRVVKRIDKIVLFFVLFSFVSSFLGCSLWHSNKKTKMVEAPPYYQHQYHQHQPQFSQQKNSTNINIDESRIFHRSDNELVNVKIFRDVELEKLQRESVELDKIKNNNTQPQTKTATQKSWFASWFGTNNNEQKKKTTTNNTPYLMSDKAKKINANLQ